MAAKLHLAENPLALHLLLERLEGLIDIVIADENLHASFLLQAVNCRDRQEIQAASGLPSRAHLPDRGRRVHQERAFGHDLRKAGTGYRPRVMLNKKRIDGSDPATSDQTQRNPDAPRAVSDPNATA
jgi:hypothetical protein